MSDNENSGGTSEDLSALSNSLGGISAALFPSGVDTALSCRAWTDLQKMEDEVVTAVDDCNTYARSGMTDIGWSGVGLWFIHSWVRDYIIRAQKLTLCGFRNNLNSKFDAEWYISVLQPNMMGVLDQEPEYILYNPIGVISISLITALIYFAPILLGGII
jgi:hypothetical protein